MPNMPTITPAEIAVFSTAVMVLYVVPFVLARIDERRRRRLPVWSSTVTATEPLDQPSATPVADTPSAAASEAAQCRDDAGGASPDEPASPAHDNAGAPATETPELPAPVGADEYASKAPEPQVVNTTALGDGSAGIPAFEPFAGTTGYQFRLEDLHRVRLADCAAMARSELRREAEGVAEAHRPAVFGSLLFSPYPIRSACCSGVEQEQSKLRLHYLLFPSLWPVSGDQAVAQAMFEIDLETGTVRHRLDAARRSELSADTRRAIRESGGDV